LHRDLLDAYKINRLKRCKCTRDMALPDGCERVTYVSNTEEFPVAVQPYEGDQSRRIAVDVATGKPLEPRQVLRKTPIGHGKFVWMRSEEVGLKGGVKPVPEYFQDEIQQLIDSKKIDSDQELKEMYRGFVSKIKKGKIVYDSKNDSARSFALRLVKCTEEELEINHPYISEILSRYEKKLKEEDEDEEVILFGGRGNLDKGKGKRKEKEKGKEKEREKAKGKEKENPPPAKKNGWFSNLLALRSKPSSTASGISGNPREDDGNHSAAKIVRPKTGTGHRVKKELPSPYEAPSLQKAGASSDPRTRRAKTSAGHRAQKESNLSYGDPWSPNDDDLPPGWKSVWHPSSQRYYFIHTESGHTQWEYPIAAVAPHGATSGELVQWRGWSPTSFRLGEVYFGNAEEEFEVPPEMAAAMGVYLDPFDPEVSLQRSGTVQHHFCSFLMHHGLWRVYFGSKPMFWHCGRGAQRMFYAISMGKKMIQQLYGKAELDDLVVVATPELWNKKSTQGIDERAIGIFSKRNFRKNVEQRREAFGIPETATPEEIDCYVAWLMSPAGLKEILKTDFRKGCAFGYSLESVRKHNEKNKSPSIVQKRSHEIAEEFPKWTPDVGELGNLYDGDDMAETHRNREFSEALDAREFFYRGYWRIKERYPDIPYVNTIYIQAMERMFGAPV